MIIDCEQHSPAWAAVRLGKVTSSRISDVVAAIKKGEAAARRNYRAELVSETLTGQALSKFITPEMRWGLEKEPFARTAYEIATGVMVTTVGFVTHPTIERLGASPDGLVDGDGLVEIKCPNTATHIDCLEAGAIPAEHEAQMLIQLACTGRKWCDFVSFDPRMPSDLQLFVMRFHRDDARIAELETKVLAFLEEIDEKIARLRMPARPPAPVAAAEAPRKPSVRTMPAPTTKKPPAPAPGVAWHGSRPKPRIDDVNQNTGRPVYACYMEYEEAKDFWLLEESLRMVLDAQRQERIALLMRPTESELAAGSGKNRILN